MKPFVLNLGLNIDETTKLILQDYWLKNEKEFTYKVNDIKKKYGLGHSEIESLLKEHPCVVIQENCIDCRCIMERIAKNRTDSKSNSYFLCNKCEEERQKAHNEYLKNEQIRKEKEKEEKENKLRRGIDDKNWIKLNKLERGALLKIIQSKGSSSIVWKIWNDGFKNKETWAALDKFENLGLINIERGSNNYVLRFEFSPDLENLLQQTIIEDSHNDINFYFHKHINKRSPRSPEYAMIISLLKDLILEPSIRYVYVGCEQAAGSIILKKITPPNSNQFIEQTNIIDEPKHIKDIIENLFDK